MMKAIWILLVIFNVTCSFSADFYRLLEDPKRGDYFLKKWEAPEPIKKDKWSNIVGGRATVPYRVKVGDTLSKICLEILGDKNYWPKLWEVNKESIKNPHLIEPNQTILFNIPEGLERLVASAKIVMAPAPKPANLESTDDLHREPYKDVSFRSLFFVEDEEVLGIITGSFESSRLLTVGHKLQVGIFDRNKVLPGKVYSVVRELRTQQKNLIQVVGKVLIEAYGDELARASVVSDYRGIERGDRLMELPLLDMKVAGEVPPPTVSTRILMGDNIEKKSFYAGDLVLLDKGTEAGIRKGHLFRIFDDVDPIFESTQLLEPRSKGEIKIVSAGLKSSTGYVQRTSAEVGIGDTLIPFDKLPSHEVPFQTQRQTSFVD